MAHCRHVVSQLVQDRRAFFAAGVQDNVMASTDQDTGGGAA